jgi:formylglycine-generating enzyme required for sulfatase activity
MKRLISFLITITIVSCSFANNLQIGTPSLSDPTHITFTVQWDNSWKISSGPTNYDAVWVFIKYQNCATNLWQHLGVSTVSGDHSVTGGILQVDATSDGKGIFIHRIANGSGNITSATVTLKMSITDVTYNYQVNGVEMVYVPQSTFSVGDGDRGGGGNKWGFTGNGALAPLTIDAAAQASGLTTSQYLSTITWGSNNNLLPTFPLGYNGFYTMKYEISQEEYVAFLNTLTYNDQSVHFNSAAGAAPNSSIGTMVLAGFPSPQHCRNGIRIKTSGTPTNIPAVVGCDLNLNGTFDEIDDGKDVACNWLSWADLIAYLDWAALRPMTEFEFEKICRGTLAPVADEYVWGTTTGPTAANSGSILNPGASNEVSLASGTGLSAYNTTPTVVGRGPLRCGFAATSMTNRVQSGSSYYGVMDMADNVAEQCIGGYQYSYGNFTNANGDGNLTNGSADTPNWPISGGGQGNNAQLGGGIVRGGDWYDGAIIQATSNRDWLTSNANQNNKDNRIGGRGVRTY